MLTKFLLVEDRRLAPCRSFLPDRAGKGRFASRQWPWLAFILFCCAAGCSAPEATDHPHAPGAHGGIVVSVGNEHHHVEALFVDGELRLHTLGEDQTRIVTVPVQELVAYLRTTQAVESRTVKLAAEPQPGDPPGETSRFVGKLPPELVGADVIVVVPTFRIGNGRYRLSFLTQAGSHDGVMPEKVTDTAEEELYLKPGGAYTEADILANGSQTASQRYRGFKSEHNLNPQTGDRICPITRTLANPKCSWTIAGQEYQFCCPPCIDEFVKRAKTSPQEIMPPDSYVKQ